MNDQDSKQVQMTAQQSVQAHQGQQQNQSTAVALATRSAELAEKARREGLTSVIAAGEEFEGNLVFKRGLKLDGRGKGEWKCTSKDALNIIAPNGFYEGTITCSRLHIYGEFKGTLNVEDLTVHSTARVSGVINYAHLEIRKGANMDETQMKRHKPNTIMQIQEFENGSI